MHMMVRMVNWGCVLHMMQSERVVHMVHSERTVHSERVLHKERVRVAHRAHGRALGALGAL